MASVHDFPQASATLAHPGQGEIEIGGRGLQAPLPEYHVEAAGRFVEDGLDITRICTVHRWASLSVPLESGMEPPRCELCEASRNFIDGFARFTDFAAKRQAGLV